MEEKQLLLEYLKRCGGSTARAAEAAGVSLATFLSRMRDNGIPVSSRGGRHRPYATVGVTVEDFHRLRKALRQFLDVLDASLANQSIAPSASPELLGDVASLPKLPLRRRGRPVEERVVEATYKPSRNLYDLGIVKRPPPERVTVRLVTSAYLLDKFDATSEGVSVEQVLVARAEKESRAHSLNWPIEYKVVNTRNGYELVATKFQDHNDLDAR
jgi:hypothetical protein